MAKVRIYELAKRIGVPAATLLQDLQARGVEASSNFSSVDEEVLDLLKQKKKAAAPAPAKPAKVPPPAPTKSSAAAKPSAAKPSPSPAKPAAVPKAPPPEPPPPPKPRSMVPILHRPASSIGSKLPPVKPAAPPSPPVPEPEAAKAAPPLSPTAHEPVRAEAPSPAVTPPTIPRKAEPATPSPEAAAPTPAGPDPGKAPVPHDQPEPQPPSAPAEQTQPADAPVAGMKRPPMLHTRPFPPAAARPAQAVPQPPAGPPASAVRRPSPPVQGPRPTGSAEVRRPQGPAPQGAGQQRPAAPAGARTAGPPQRSAQGPIRPQGAPSGQRPPASGRPAAGPGRGRPAGPAPAPSTAPAPRPASETHPSRPAPSDARRKTKRERRLEKLQARVDRQERLDQEIIDAQAKAEKGEAVFIREGITVKELADKLSVKVKDIIAKLMMRGILVTINQPLDSQVAIQVSSMFGFQAEVISFEDELVLTQEDVPAENKAPRAPVVTVMGHVDHGKSSLLEAIHDVDITSKEFGGITQHIGAYRVRHGEREYVFLDTPGHEAFTLMRARGAQVTDVVILVVAADDGVMPQTVEAINHCKAANVPFVVAVNKMDKPGADPDRVKRELMQHGIVTEEFGGETVAVPVSAKSRQGIQELLEMVALVADMLDLDAAPDSPAMGTVLESKLDRTRGPVATVLIQDGTLRVGDFFLCGSTFGHVRGLFDDKGERVEVAGPSTPVEILGFSEVPGVGSVFQAMLDEAKARQVAAFRKEQEKAKALRSSKVRLENVFGAIKQGEIQELSVILKADVQGSLEAIAQQVQDLSTDEVKVAVVHKGVGAVSEGDVLLASASNAIIIGFNVRPERKAADVAKNEGVEIALFTVIYDLVDRLKLALTGMLKPIEQEVLLGHADVKEIFKVSKVGTIAGCIVADGRIPRTAQLRVLRDNVVVHTGRIGSLKRFKDDASEVKEGLECGIGLENYNDVKPGDVLEAFEIQIQERTL